MTLPRAPQRITPAFALSIAKRAIHEGLALRNSGRREMDEVVRFFYDDRDAECVYCGSVDVRRWDHVVPVMRGGDTVLGNMVLGCAPCDDSKQDSDFEQWMTSEAPLSPRSRDIVDIARRVQRIRQYVGHFGYEARPIEQRLDERERDELQAIERQVKEARQRLDQLILDYRARVGANESVAVAPATTMSAHESMGKNN